MHGCRVAELRPAHNASGVARVAARACVRAAVWEEWLWCGGARGVLRLPKRARAPAPPRAARAPARALTALLLLHAAQGGGAPACARACHASALCVRAPGGGVACLCPDGLAPLDDAATAVSHDTFCTANAYFFVNLFYK